MKKYLLITLFQLLYCYVLFAQQYNISGIVQNIRQKILPLTVSDVFNTLRYQGVSQSNISIYYYNDKPDSRRLGITLHYHFGSDTFKNNKQ